MNIKIISSLFLKIDTLEMRYQFEYKLFVSLYQDTLKWVLERLQRTREEVFRIDLEYVGPS